MSGGRTVRSLLLLGLLAGCRPGVEWLDERDRAEPLLKQARAKRNEGDIDGAIALYHEALRTEQRLALANLDLALLLHDEKKQYLDAVCHYKRYLEARPETEKGLMIRKRMELALQAYHARHAPAAGRALPEAAAGSAEGAAASASELAAARRRAESAREEARSATERAEQLEEQKRVLESTVRRLQGELEQAKVLRRAADRDTREPSAVVVPDAATRSYEVMPGDSLSSIAAAVYGDGAQWRKIFEANRELLGGSQRLRPGQVLVIP